MVSKHATVRDWIAAYYTAAKFEISQILVVCYAPVQENICIAADNLHTYLQLASITMLNWTEVTCGVPQG